MCWGAAQRAGGGRARHGGARGGRAACAGHRGHRASARLKRGAVVVPAGATNHQRRRSGPVTGRRAGGPPGEAADLADAAESALSLLPAARTSNGDRAALVARDRHGSIERDRHHVERDAAENEAHRPAHARPRAAPRPTRSDPVAPRGRRSRGQPLDRDPCRLPAVATSRPSPHRPRSTWRWMPGRGPGRRQAGRRTHTDAQRRVDGGQGQAHVHQRPVAGSMPARRPDRRAVIGTLTESSRPRPPAPSPRRGRRPPGRRRARAVQQVEESEAPPTTSRGARQGRRCSNAVAGPSISRRWAEMESWADSTAVLAAEVERRRAGRGRAASGRTHGRTGASLPEAEVRSGAGTASAGPTLRPGRRRLPRSTGRSTTLAYRADLAPSPARLPSPASWPGCQRQPLREVGAERRSLLSTGPELLQRSSGGRTRWGSTTIGVPGGDTERDRSGPPAPVGGERSGLAPLRWRWPPRRLAGHRVRTTRAVFLDEGSDARRDARYRGRRQRRLGQTRRMVASSRTSRLASGSGRFEVPRRQLVRPPEVVLMEVAVESGRPIRRAGDDGRGRLGGRNDSTSAASSSGGRLATGW